MAKGESELSWCDDSKQEGLLWLAEKRHPSKTVIRFSGTLQHPTAHCDTLHLTVYAFLHFVYGYTKQQLVFADVQGKPEFSNILLTLDLRLTSRYFAGTPITFESDGGKTVNGILLFDPMTHTTIGYEIQRYLAVHGH